MNKFLNFEHGQVILILLLVMTIGLGVGLSIISRSLSDISTATKVEQSSRAFSAAEAGIEKALRGDLSGVDFYSDNQSLATVTDSGLIPTSGQALEYPPISKEEIAHFWLSNPATTPPSLYYNQSSIDIFWGKPGLSDPDKPAIAITLIYISGGTYSSRKFFIDPNSSRRSSNGFSDPSDPSFSPGNCLNPTLNTTFGVNRPFYCKVRLQGLPTSPSIQEVLRIRLLYTSVAQPLAVVPVGVCGGACSLPPQAHIYTSSGSSGDTQRTIQLFKLDKVVPFYFDFALFSAGDITK